MYAPQADLRETFRAQVSQVEKDLAGDRETWQRGTYPIPWQTVAPGLDRCA